MRSLTQEEITWGIAEFQRGCDKTLEELRATVPTDAMGKIQYLMDISREIGKLQREYDRQEGRVY